MLKNIPSINNLEEQFAECPSTDFSYVNDWMASGWIGNINLDLIISYAIRQGASDIHIIGGQEICFTILGDIVKQPQFSIPDEDEMADLVSEMLTHLAMSNYVVELEYDTAYTVRFGPYTGRRLRVNIGKSFELNQLTLRVINDKIPELDELGITSDLTNWFGNTSGVILICGSTGSGKSTTLASIIRDIQLKKKLKIITIEKPIEYIYPKDGSSLIVQRAIPEDCRSFNNGLTSAMRSAPDIILIGEVRDKIEIDNLLRAAETGHLSLSTMHTSNSVTTLNRIRSQYEGSEQKRILSTLGDNLRGIMNQVLVKSKDGKSRFAVREMLPIDYKLRRLIANDEILKVREWQEENELTMEHELVKVYMEDLCTFNEAMSKAPDQIYFKEIAKSKGIDISKVNEDKKISKPKKQVAIQSDTFIDSDMNRNSIFDSLLDDLED